MSEPLSATTTSPGKIFFKKSKSSVNYLSLTRPYQAFDINDMTPCGLIPIKNFMVLLCVYCDQVHTLPCNLKVY